MPVLARVCESFLTHVVIHFCHAFEIETFQDIFDASFGEEMNGATAGKIAKVLIASVGVRAEGNFLVETVLPGFRQRAKEMANEGREMEEAIDLSTGMRNMVTGPQIG